MAQNQMGAQQFMIDDRTLWMGEIEPWMTEEYISKLFPNAPILSIRIHRDKTAAGYCFLEFKTHEQALQYLNNFNGKQMPGTKKTFKLNWGAFGTGSKMFANTLHTSVQNVVTTGIFTSTQCEFQIFVGDIDSSVTDQVLFDFFKQHYHSVIAAKVTTDPMNRLSKGYGFVRFSNQEEGQRAIQEMNGRMLRNRCIKCTPAVQNKGSADISSVTQNPYTAAMNPYMMCMPFMNSMFGMTGQRVPNLLDPRLTAQFKLQQMHQQKQQQEYESRERIIIETDLEKDKEFIKDLSAVHAANYWIKKHEQIC